MENLLSLLAVRNPNVNSYTNYKSQMKIIFDTDPPAKIFGSDKMFKAKVDQIMNSDLQVTTKRCRIQAFMVAAKLLKLASHEAELAKVHAKLSDVITARAHMRKPRTVDDYIKLLEKVEAHFGEDSRIAKYMICFGSFVPRGELAGIQVVNNGMLEHMADDKNYINVDNRTLILNDSKTTNKYGKRVVEIDPEFIEDFDRIDLQPGSFPFPKTYNTSLNKIIREIPGLENFKGGVVNFMRQALASNYETPEELVELASKMGHSVSTHISQYQSKI